MIKTTGKKQRRIATIGDKQKPVRIAKKLEGKPPGDAPKVQEDTIFEVKNWVKNICEKYDIPGADSCF